MKQVIYKKPQPPMVSKNLYDINSDCWKQQRLRVREINNDITKGKGAVLCFLDDGIGQNNELLLNEIERWSFFEDLPIWAGNHSTNAATIVGGATLGIFPEMGFISKQVLVPDTGLGGTRQIVSAIYQALENDIRTINLSIGSDSPDPEIEKALRTYCGNGKNIATVAAGNDGHKTDYPARYAKNIKGVLSIAATQIDLQGNVTVAMFSSRGVVSLGAPGYALKAMDNNNRLDFVSGTSFSAPIVGATIAVARTIKPEITQDEILYLLKSTARVNKNESEEVRGKGYINIYDFLMSVRNNEYKPKSENRISNSKNWFCSLFCK